MERIAPDPVVPTPAAQFAELRGRRLIIGVPGIGFRGDLRADNSVVQGGRTFVPVLTEQDYYRAEMDQIEAFAPLVPIDRVWVEDVAKVSRPQPPVLDVPAVRHPLVVEASRRLIGQRVIQAVPDGFLRNLRAISDMYANAAGVHCVRICSESEWYGWAMTGRTPRSLEVAATHTWLE